MQCRYLAKDGGCPVLTLPIRTCGWAMCRPLCFEEPEKMLGTYKPISDAPERFEVRTGVRTRRAFVARSACMTDATMPFPWSRPAFDAPGRNRTCLQMSTFAEPRTAPGQHRVCTGGLVWHDFVSKALRRGGRDARSLSARFSLHRAHDHGIRRRGGTPPEHGPSERPRHRPCDRSRRKHGRRLDSRYPVAAGRARRAARASSPRS